MRGKKKVRKFAGEVDLTFRIDDGLGLLHVRFGDPSLTERGDDDAPLQFGNREQALTERLELPVARHEEQGGGGGDAEHLRMSGVHADVFKLVSLENAAVNGNGQNVEARLLLQHADERRFRLAKAAVRLEEEEETRLGRNLLEKRVHVHPRRPVNGVDAEGRRRAPKGFVEEGIAERHLLRNFGDLLTAVDGEALEQEVGLDVFGRRIAPHQVLVLRQHVAHPFGRERLLLRHGCGLRWFFGLGRFDELFFLRGGFDGFRRIWFL